MEDKIDMFFNYTGFNTGKAVLINFKDVSTISEHKDYVMFDMKNGKNFVVTETINDVIENLGKWNRY